MVPLGPRPARSGTSQPASHLLHRRGTLAHPPGDDHHGVGVRDASAGDRGASLHPLAARGYARSMRRSIGGTSPGRGGQQPGRQGVAGQVRGACCVRVRSPPACEAGEEGRERGVTGADRFHRAGLGRECVGGGKNGCPNRISEVWARYHAPVLSPQRATAGSGRPALQGHVQRESAGQRASRWAGMDGL